MRQRWVVVVLAISLVTVACDKKKKDEGKGNTPSETGAKKKDEPSSPKDDLSLLPVDSELVLGMKASAIFGTALWKQYVQPEIEKDSDFVRNMAKFKDRCGIDPMTHVTELSMGVKNLDDVPSGIFVLHGLDKSKVMGCTDKWDQEAKEQKLTIKKDGDVVTVTDDGTPSTTIGFMFISGDRMLIVLGEGVTADTIRKAAQGGSVLSTSPAFVDMHGKIAKDASAWFLMNGTSKIFEEAQQAIGVRPKAVFGSINVSDSLSADVRARLDSPDQAKQLVSSFKGQVDAMASMVDKVELVSDGADVRLTAAASNQKLQSLFKMIAGGM